MAAKEKMPAPFPGKEDKEDSPEKEAGTKCPACGAPVPEGATACPSCGKELKEKAMAEATVSLEEFNALKSAMAEFKEARDESQKEIAELKGKYAEADEARKNLEESNQSLAEQQARLVELNNMMRLHEKVVDFMHLSESKIIAPAYEEAILSVLLLTENIEKEQEILDLFGALATGEALVPLGELGTSRTPGPRIEGPGENRRILSEKAFKFAADHNVDYKSALIEVSRKEEKE